MPVPTDKVRFQEETADIINDKRNYLFIFQGGDPAGNVQAGQGEIL